jgi:hypothetical protein
MRRLYKFDRNQASRKNEVAATGTVVRPSNVRSILPKNTTDPTNPINSNTGLADYDNILVGSSYVLFRRYLDWSSGSNQYFMRDTVNPYILKGRFRAQAFNLLGTTVETTTSVVKTIPDFTRTCPEGYSLDSSAGNCKSNKPGEDWTEIGGEYLGPCGAGFRLVNSTDRTCERVCTSYGANYRLVDGVCKDMCRSGFKPLNNTKCITDCSTINDSTGRAMEDDSDTLCVTSKPTISISRRSIWTPNYKKVRITESGQPDKYAWVDIDWPEWIRKSWDRIETSCNWDYNQSDDFIFDLWFTTDRAGISGALSTGRNSYQYILEMELVKWRSGILTSYNDNFCGFHQQWLSEWKKSNPRRSLKQQIDDRFNTKQFVYTEYSDRTQEDRLPAQRFDTVYREVQTIKRAAYI